MLDGKVLQVFIELHGSCSRILELAFHIHTTTAFLQHSSHENYRIIIRVFQAIMVKKAYPFL